VDGDVRLDERLASLREAGKRAAVQSRREQGLETPLTDRAALKRLETILDGLEPPLPTRPNSTANRPLLASPGPDARRAP